MSDDLSEFAEPDVFVQVIGFLAVCLLVLMFFLVVFYIKRIHRD